VLAIELGLPWSPEAAAEVLAAGRMRPLAVGTAAAADALAARRFLLFCGAGLDGAIVHRLAAVRTGTLGKRKWAGPILHAIRHWPRFALRAELDGGEVLDGLGSVLVTRVRNYGGVMRLTPDVDPSDGLLHVLGFRMHTRRAFAWQCLRGLTLGLRAGRDLLVRTTTGLRVTGSAPLQVDGDAGGTAPVDVGLLPARARVFAPNMAGTTSRTASGARAPD
jgi:diacylglycerol kinase (ATP)